MEYKITNDIFDDAEHFGWDNIKNQRDMYSFRENAIREQDAVKLIIWLTKCDFKEAIEALSKFKHGIQG
tara:strand:+ start:1030 stop:1236 length:207 start_codon:yes stop_codon:yes gene_type:complete